jgi:hypothetical protein
MVWFCTVCNGKNLNTSKKCRINKCHAPRPEIVVNNDSKKVIRDYCPKCQKHTNFVRRSMWSKKYKCPGCKRMALFHGEPVPEFPVSHTGVMN